jgi:hypothetical protein
VAVAGTAVEARADCHYVRGSIAETRIPSNDQFGRLLGTVTGVLNGASTVVITSLTPVQSYDVFLTTAGDVLIATGVPTRTPVPGEPGEFITHVDLTVVGGSGKYAEATGTMTFSTAGLTRARCPQPLTSSTREPCVGRMSKAAGTERSCRGNRTADRR